ncbi:MAG: hypothetical protein ACPGSC_08565, partial [Granulosicoccaceae bacterium]
AQLIATAYGGDTKGYLGDNPSTNPDAPDVYKGAVLEDRLDGAIDVGLEGRSERAVWRFDASLLSDSLLQDISLDTDFDETDPGEGNEDNDDGTVRDDVTRVRLTATPSYSYKLSPISNLRTSLTMRSATYDNTDQTDLKDSDEFALFGAYRREFSPINSWGIDAAVDNFEAEDSGTFDSFVLGASVSHKFTETSVVGLRVAQAASDFDYAAGFTNANGEYTTRSTSGSANKPIVQLTGSQTTGRTKYSFQLGTNLHGSASGEVVSANELLLNVVYQYSELMTLTWRNKFFENESLRDFLPVGDDVTGDDETHNRAYNATIEDANRRYLAFEPTLNWRFSRWWVMDAGMRYQREKRYVLGNPGESYYAFIGVTYSKPIGVQIEN